MAIKALCIGLALVCAAMAAPESRIVGGTPVGPGEFPYAVALLYHYPNAGITIQRCVGALISSWHVLTTSHCFNGAILSNLVVRAGSTNSMGGGSVVTASHVIRHPDYQQSPRTADIAVLVLATPLPISSTIDILYLPAQGTHIPDGQSLKVVSWGFESISGPQLQFLKSINLRKVSLEACVAAYAGDDSAVIDDTVICAAGEGLVGTCTGDSGAPMVRDQVLVGISSHFKECGDGSYPDVFTRVDRFTDWIMSVATRPSGAEGDFTASARVKTIQ
ncbi:trypsin-1-like [Battus philenor]|uniref:trypsin-1-like n=1 Tax=Battus philenor TaxID=42288 RepID=UPI0035CF39A8